MLRSDGNPSLAGTRRNGLRDQGKGRRPGAERFVFEAAKTMYGGKRIGPGDEVFVFASETQGGAGLVARAIVEHAAPVAPLAGVERQTPRMRLTLSRTGPASRPLGRSELKRFADWDDGRPETELNVKLYRQATDKLVGLSDAAAEFLRGFFDA